jgi:hypothetical protein
MTAGSKRNEAWQALDLPAVMRIVAASDGGLSEADAARRLQAVGANRLPQAPPPAWWRILLRQFQSPLI